LDRIVEKTLQNLKTHHFRAYYFPEIKDLKEHIMLLLSQYKSVAFGGSTTLIQTGIKDFITENASVCIERKTGGTDDEKLDSERRALTSDLYVCSANAVSSEGLLINIDKRGNRVGALTFGPKKVLIIASINKIAENTEKALERAKNIASVKNCERFNLETPCRKIGRCVDCEHEQNICYVTVFTKRCYPHERIDVCFIDGDYGF